ncbi:PREDICTED: E3 ubiquitin-protein ligase E3D-like [Acropora digitifera]|uniref:E3 ubiquitin-protein ligase E3D-like n=1 Tax=Acropora digitifera TaxID=70779 RepID=UPI00077ACFF4|nr:PREDICTED: E3 ubiquitin-protein ligase E3D-like [Acropora digitifera]
MSGNWCLRHKKMADKSNNLPVWLDVGKNLNALSLNVGLGCFVKERTLQGGSFRRFIRIHTRKLTSDDDDRERSGESKNIVHYPGSITLRPSLVSGISTCRGKELQMRVQFEYVVGHHREDVPREHLKQELKELKNNSVCVCCRMCGSTILLHERGFKRVLELPSENWIQLAQNWCCHGNNNLSNMTGALEPDENDCFVGEYYIKVNSSSVVSDNLQILPGEELYLLKCSRCHAVLGNVSKERRSLNCFEFCNMNSILLYKHKISTRHNNLFSLYCTESFITSCLISRSQGAVNFRFLVQDGSRFFACLWLFNVDAAVVTNIETRDVQSLSDSNKNGLYYIKSKANYLPVLKILYKIKPFRGDISWDQEVTAWQENPTVESLLFSKETCLHLILLLIQSTNTIAPSLREVNGFKVGYLRTMNMRCSGE